MKRFLLSGIVSVVFLFYVLVQRHSSDAAAVIPPAGFVSPPVSTQSQTPTQTTPQSTAPAQTAPLGQTANLAPTPRPVPAPKPAAQYKDGQFTGTSADAYYGYVQVRAIVAGGKISDVVFLDYPSDRGTSRMINQQAMPYLRAEALSAQSANVNIVSGATDTSLAFRESLAAALAQAKN